MPLNTYTLVEIDPDGRRLSEMFRAPCDVVALERVQDVVSTARFQVWRGQTLVADHAGPTGGPDSRTLH